MLIEIGQANSIMHAFGIFGGGPTVRRVGISRGGLIPDIIEPARLLLAIDRIQIEFGGDGRFLVKDPLDQVFSIGPMMIALPPRRTKASGVIASVALRTTR